MKKTLSTPEDFMQRAVELALKAKGRTSPNPLVGAVLVKDGKIVGEGWHRRCGADHAEIVALKQAGARAKGATLYVTLEPCAHWGRTPPCADAIIQAGVRKIVIGMTDPNPLTKGKSRRKMRRAGLEVTGGAPPSSCLSMNEAYVKFITTGRPWVVTKTAQTLDGKIATARGESQWITSAGARQYARRIRNEFDAICVGVNTVLADDPRLNGTRSDKRLKKIVLDPTLRISPKARLFQGADPQDCLIVTTALASKAKVEAFRTKGVSLLVGPGTSVRSRTIDLKWLLRQLGQRQITSVLVEGGAGTVGRFLQQGVVDKMFIYVAPQIIGDQKALSSVTGLDIQRLNRAVRLGKLSVQPVGKDILVTGYVLRNR